MAQTLAELDVPLSADQAGDQGKGILRRCRGRPRLTDSDRAQRRLESRKKYDVRRVYLGESHKLWTELRRRTSLSDAGLAEYLLLLNSAYGEKYQQKHYPPGRMEHASSLQSLVCWYQEHSRSCSHEPQLRALDPQPSLSTAAIWQCDYNHSFVQYLFPPPREASDSEREALMNKKDNGVNVAKTNMPMANGVANRKRRKEDHRNFKGVMSNLKMFTLCNLGSCRDVGTQEVYCFFSLNLLCFLPVFFHHQLIIITGPSYEALASEGIKFNMDGTDLEEVTCTVIGGVTYHQVCASDAKLRIAEDEESMTGLLHSELVLHCLSFRMSTFIRSKRNRRGPVIEADGMLKMFHCPYEGCSQVYVAISSFQNHVNLVHRKGRTKVCPHPGCGKKFYLSNHLHRHMIIHSGVRDFICETCGKSFKRKNHLEVHRRTHTGETPLQCEICGYQCRQRASLNWHMKKHTPEAYYNYTCELCQKRFEKLDSVKFHKLKSHPDKQAT
uniref:Zinc finger protein 653 n=1 Tax=Mola mola TaxID=94237 RepID=A0A3Q4ATQ3_MOLML